MTPRVDIVAVDAGAEWKEVLQVAQASKVQLIPWQGFVHVTNIHLVL